MWCCRDQDHVTILLHSELRDQLKALMASAASLASRGTGMRLVHHHKIGTGTHKIGATTIRFNKIRRDDEVGIAVKDRLIARALALQLGNRTGEHQGGINMKFRLQ